MNLVLILSLLINSQEREPHLINQFIKVFHVGLCLDIYKLNGFFRTQYWDRYTWALQFDTSLNDLTFNQSHHRWKKQNLICSYLCNCDASLSAELDENQNVATTCWYTDPYEYYMDLCNKFYSSAAEGLSISLVAQALTLDITLKLFEPIFFNACNTYWHHWLIPVYITFTDLNLDLGLQGQHKAKPLSFILSYTFQLIRMKTDLVLKQFKLNILILFLSEIWWIMGNNCRFSDCIKTI